MFEVFEYFVVNSLGLQLENAPLSTINSRINKDSFLGRINEGFNLFTLILKLADEYP